MSPGVEKTNVLHMQKTKTQISFAVTTKLISAFVFATWKVQYLYFLNTKFQASSHLQWQYSLVCVGPGQNPHCWFSQAGAHIIHFYIKIQDLVITKKCLYWQVWSTSTYTVMQNADFVKSL